jgi:hypothetical protein
VTIGPSDPTSNPDTLDQARRALATAEGIVARDQRNPGWRTSLLALGSSPEAYQAAYLRHAQAAATVALAEQTQRIADQLDQLIKMMDGRLRRL